jgi:hypothetical protein
MNTGRTFTSMGDYSIGHRIVVDQLTGMDDGIVLSKPRQLKTDICMQFHIPIGFHLIALCP